MKFGLYRTHIAVHTLIDTRKQELSSHDTPALFDSNLPFNYFFSEIIYSIGFSPK